MFSAGCQVQRKAVSDSGKVRREATEKSREVKWECKNDEGKEVGRQ